MKKRPINAYTLLEDVVNKMNNEAIIRGEWEEYWGQEYMCPVCLTRWMAFDKHNNEIANYCPGCGRKASDMVGKGEIK